MAGQEERGTSKVPGGIEFMKLSVEKQFWTIFLHCTPLIGFLNQSLFHHVLKALKLFICLQTHIF